jgi:hypothetical protein
MDHTSSINERIRKKEGKVVGTLFQINSHVSQRVLASSTLSDVEYPFNILLATQHQLNLNMEYKNSEEVLSLFLRHISKDEEWTVPVFKEIVKSLFILSKNERERCLKTLADLLKDTLRDLEMNPRGTLVLFLANITISLYKSMGSYKMIDNLLSILKNKDVDMGGLSMKDVKIFHFYKGIVGLWREDLIEGVKCLKYSFNVRGKEIRKIIAPFYFISLLSVGRCVKKSVLEKYGCIYLKGLIDCVLKGDIVGYESELEKQKEFYLKSNLYRLMCVNVSMIVHRNMLRRVYSCMSTDFRLWARHVVMGYSLLNSNMKSEEINCILMNLISLGYVRGYLSLNKEMIVFSRIDPFPMMDNEIVK